MNYLIYLICPRCALFPSVGRPKVVKGGDTQDNAHHTPCKANFQKADFLDNAKGRAINDAATTAVHVVPDPVPMIVVRAPGSLSCARKKVGSRKFI